tara:strand:+ start:785 stop:919 length:135 start_codon:yes stop_codon:yes gene_type:complete
MKSVKNKKGKGSVTGNTASGAPERKRIKMRGVGAATKGLMFYES